MMEYSELLNNILMRARMIQEEEKIKYLSASCIVIATTELCEEKYVGLSKYDTSSCPELYEEERLRYLCGKAYRLPRLTGICMKKALQKEFS